MNIDKVGKGIDMSARTMSAKLVDAKKVIPEPMTKHVFSNAGEKLGYVEPVFLSRDKPSWHAVFNIGNYAHGIGLAQGHGDTPTEAIEKAIENAKEGIDYSIDKLDELEQKIYRITKE